MGSYFGGLVFSKDLAAFVSKAARSALIQQQVASVADFRHWHIFTGFVGCEKRPRSGELQTF